MSKEEKLVPIMKDGYKWVGEHYDDNCYLFCPICDEQVGINDNVEKKCHNCGQLLDTENAYEYQDTDYYKQLYEITTEQLKAENERLKEEVSKSYLVKLFDDENKKLKQQLKEKDEEIEKWKNKVEELSIKATSFKKIIEDENEKEKFIKTNTKQVCDKIKSEIIDLAGFTENELRDMIYDLDAKTVLEILDKTEKGEV